jgi:hypothetical protein
MTHAEAMRQVYAGKRVCRAYWHWCWLELIGSRIRFCDDDNPGGKEDYSPAAGDTTAEDWVDCTEAYAP